MMEIERPKIETASLSPDGRYGKFVAERRILHGRPYGDGKPVLRRAAYILWL